MKKIWFYLMILTISACNFKNKNTEKEIIYTQLSKETYDFRIDFNPERAYLFDNSLILFGKDSLEKYNIISIDLIKNVIDTIKTHELFNSDISCLLSKNDTLFAYFYSQKNWRFWNNEWIKYDLTNEQFYLDYKKLDMVKYLYEDDNYVVFAIDIGEFGGTINFYNKKTSKLYAAEIYGVNFCTKESNEYFVNGSLAHMEGSVEIVKIKNPDNLHFIPDSLNIYNHDSIGDYYNFLKSCEYNLLPDTLVEKIKDYSKFDYNSYLLSKQIIKSKLGIETIIDTFGILSFSTFEYNNQIIHFIQDTSLYIGTVKEDSLYRLENLYNEYFFSYNSSTQVKDKTILMTFYYWQRKSKPEKSICLIFTDNKLKRYNIY